MLSIRYFFFIILLLFPIIVISSGNYIEYSSNNGLPSSTVYTISQDKKGYIWIGCKGGAVKFDGNNFELINYEKGVLMEEVLKIYVDKKDRVWFIPYTGFLSYYLNGKVYNHLNTPYLKKLHTKYFIYQVKEDHHGNIWFCNSDGLIKFDKNNFTSYFRNKIYGTKINCNYIWTDKRGELNIETNYGSINIRDFINKKNSLPLLSNKSINSPFRPTYIESKNSLISLQGRTLIEKDKKNEYSITKFLDSTIISSIPISVYNDSENIWLLSKEEVICMDNKYNKKNTLKGLSLSCFFKDNEGNIWLGSTQKGLYFIPSYSLNNSKLNFTSNLNITSIHYSHHDSTLYFGTNDGVLFSKQSDKIKTYKTTKTPFSNEINSILTDKYGVLWIGSTNGIYKLINGNLVYLPINNVKKMVYDNEHIIYLSRPNGIFAFNILSKQISIEKIFPFVPQDFDYSSEQKKLFIISNLGVYSFSENHVLKKITSFDNNLIYNEAKLISDGIMLIIDKQNKTNLYSLTDSIKKIRHRKTTIKQPVLFPLNNKNIVYSALSFKRYAFSIENKIKASTKFKTSLLSLYKDINCIIIYNDSLLIGTKNGLFQIKDFIDEHTLKLPPLYLDNIKSYNRKINYQDGFLNLPYDSNTLSINFTSISFNLNNEVGYKYILSHDKKRLEHDIIKSPKITLNFLKSGYYSLKVFAGYPSLNKWNVNPLEVNFLIEKPYWKKMWFQSIILFVFTFLISSIIYTVQKNHYKKELLRAKVILSEQKALRAQLNPHFISNAFNSVQAFFLTGEEVRGYEYFEKLNKLVRLILDNSDKLTNNIQEELDFLILYMDIEKLRTQNKFNYKIIVDEIIQKDFIQLPTMIIQPIIENSIWHGFKDIKNGMLILEIKQINNSIVIKVDDNGVGRSFQTNKYRHKKSLKSSSLIESRINLLNKLRKTPIKIFYKDKTNKQGSEGTCVTITIPIN